MLISIMEQEARQAPDVFRTQLACNQAVLNQLAARVKQIQPKVAMTIARGSSDHAATFAKYLLETVAGMITASAAPSVVTLYKKQLPVKNCLVLGISQSGASPDIVETFLSARQQGAITVAIVNQVDSPLAKAAEYVVPLCAGEEKAVAATKTYLATLCALIHIVATITEDRLLLNAIHTLPERLQQATEQDWSPAVDIYLERRNTFVVGRGYGFPIAQEAALKFKETARIHAEAFSGAELLHGPFALIEQHFPVMLLAQQDEAFPGMLAVAKKLEGLGAEVLFASPQREGLRLAEDVSCILPMPQGLHAICDPLIIIQAFYIMMARLSIARGLNPDLPTHLSKVTKTW